jgi:hypothetical protein
MIPKSGHRFSDKIMLGQKSMIPKSGHRVPACAKPWHGLLLWLDASAGEGRPEKIMLH